MHLFRALLQRGPRYLRRLSIRHPRPSLSVSGRRSSPEARRGHPPERRLQLILAVRTDGA